MEIYSNVHVPKVVSSQRVVFSQNMAMWRVVSHNPSRMERVHDGVVLIVCLGFASQGLLYQLYERDVFRDLARNGDKEA